jgi:hypothetical protein
MAVADMATQTLVKAKQYTSTVFLKLTRGLTQAEFMRRSRKIALVCLAVWLAGNAVGYIIYRSTEDQTRDEFYRIGTTATRNLSQEGSPLVLEKDVLMLNLATRALEKNEAVALAAVLDHQGQILARTGPEELVRQLKPLLEKPLIGTLDGVGFSGLVASGGKELILFSQPITYSKVDIGKAVVALWAQSLQQSSERAKSIFGSGIVAITFLMVAFLLWYDRSQKKKALERIQRMKSEDAIGPYHLISKVAQGGMAELYLADCLREDGFRRRVAVKRILPHFTSNEDFVQMFIREARLAALLQHPNIVQVFDYGKVEDISFIAMEYIDGKNLGQVIAETKTGLPIEPAVFVFSEICKGLEYSHTRVDDQTGEPLNLVHRDISPQNILVSYQGEVKISDFGISKAKTEPNLTQTGKLKGKLMYLAPEQLTGENVDHRLDLYALGLVFYQTLTGSFAYQFDSEVEAIKNIPTITIEPLKSRKAGVPEQLDRIVMRCLEKNVTSRYQSAAAILADLTAFRREQQITFDSADLAALLKDKFKPGARA